MFEHVYLHSKVVVLRSHGDPSTDLFQKNKNNHPSLVFVNVESFAGSRGVKISHQSDGPQYCAVPHRNFGSSASAPGRFYHGETNKIWCPSKLILEQVQCCLILIRVYGRYIYRIL